ncbi:hypothetical protein [Chromobacterium subtsugae]|uniref:hypothetical protein n=1 Tax=Chromobacterium subtsugae TaxID=251747 RepID=UPI0006413B0A|nr:hypothetical protein [Chromobacterium subtsugae]
MQEASDKKKVVLRVGIGKGGTSTNGKDTVVKVDDLEKVGGYYQAGGGDGNVLTYVLANAQKKGAGNKPVGDDIRWMDYGAAGQVRVSSLVEWDAESVPFVWLRQAALRAATAHAEGKLGHQVVGLCTIDSDYCWAIDEVGGGMGGMADRADMKTTEQVAEWVNSTWKHENAGPLAVAGVYMWHVDQEFVGGVRADVANSMGGHAKNRPIKWAVEDGGAKLAVQRDPGGTAKKQGKGHAEDGLREVLLRWNEWLTQEEVEGRKTQWGVHPLRLYFPEPITLFSAQAVGILKMAGVEPSNTPAEGKEGAEAIRYLAADQANDKAWLRKLFRFEGTWRRQTRMGKNRVGSLVKAFVKSAATAIDGLRGVGGQGEVTMGEVVNRLRSVADTGDLDQSYVGKRGEVLGPRVHDWHTLKATGKGLVKRV